eukprot:1049643-Amphidinium_carterae.1
MNNLKSRSCSRDFQKVFANHDTQHCKLQVVRKNDKDRTLARKTQNIRSAKGSGSHICLRYYSPNHNY